jgi:amino acid transporter
MGIVAATAMSITIVVGAGLLVLPGLSFSLAGRLGYVPWLAVAVLMIPLLAIFSYFAREMPSAGGVVGYARASLGSSAASMAEVIVLGTFSLGIPAIALIGAVYLQQILPGLSVPGAALGTLTVAYLAGVVGLRISGALQTAMAALIVVGLLGIALGYLFFAAPGSFATDEPVVVSASWQGVALAIPVVLFAFTGWEMTAFLAEDMKDVKRTLPVSIWASFVLVTFMYVLIAWIVASHATGDERWTRAPFVQLARGWLGSAGAQIVALIASLLVIANVIAAFLAASRAVFSAGRDGLLPRRLASLNRRQQPLIAMTCTYLLFASVITFSQLAQVGVDTLLQLAGQNFFVLYLCAAVGYAKLHRGHPQRWIAYAAAVSVLAMMSLFSMPGLLYCGTLAAVGGWVAWTRERRTRLA